ncbi:MAG: hypothetical protein QHJ73_05260 [Armatimonadota bacterium]|nr:hypothetical protein [Armatimonadota bacterium]
MRVLFVCQANMCRSPLAEALGRRIASERGVVQIHFRSCGLYAAEGMGAVPQVIEIAERLGADLSAHQSRPFSMQLGHWADYIVAMTRSQKEEVLRRLPVLRRRTFTFAEWVYHVTGTRPRWRDVVDPVGGPPEGFEKCAALLYDALSNVMDVVSGEVPRREPRGLARLFARPW